MTALFPLGASESTMHKLTQKQLQAWSQRGALHKKELTDLLTCIARDLSKSNSPTKIIERTSKRLEKFFAQKEVRGTVIEKNQRRIRFELSFPLEMNEGIGFCILTAEVNARTGMHTIHESEPIFISTHVLQRLLQRVEFKNESAALDEIYSCLSFAPYWKEAAVELKAFSWPILSKDGIFIAVLTEGDSSSSLITWLKGETLSRKWGVVYYNLLSLLDHNAQLMVCPVFIKEFLGSFPWMMQEHSPEADLNKLAWESKDNINIQDIEKSSSTVSKTSVSFIPGMNYKTEGPPFKTHSQLDGVVVQKKPNGELVVSLNNAWVGLISIVSYKKTKELLPNLEELFVGDKVRVEVRKINFDENEMAYSVSLDRVELVEFIWKGILEKYPVDTVVKGTIFANVGSDCAVQIEEGVRGLVPVNQVKLYCAAENINNNQIGLNLELLVTGYKAGIRNLIFELPGQKHRASDFMAKTYSINQRAEGFVAWRNDKFAVIELDSGFNALLHHYNCWGRPLPEANQSVLITIIHIDIDSQQIRLSLTPSIVIDKIFPAIPFTEERWLSFTANHKVGDRVEIQILTLEEGYYVAATSLGDYGIIPFKEISWARDMAVNSSACKVGEIFEVQIKRIKNKQVIFSKKSLQKHPLELLFDELDFDKKYSGIVLNVVDYGYFIGLDLGFDGLLHKNNVSNYGPIKIGDVVDVFINEVDLESKRVSLSIG